MDEKLIAIMKEENNDVVKLPIPRSVNPLDIFITLSVDVNSFAFLAKGTHCGK